MDFFHRRARLEIEGLMPERALVKLKRAEIPLFEVRKTQKNRILLSVNKKDIEKVFAIYPKVCYNNAYNPYQVRFLGETGVGKILSWLKNRAGFVLGALAFGCVSLFFDSFTFGVVFVGSSVYEREAKQALEGYGVKPFARYADGNEDLICSKLLALDGVEFCSVKKQGLWVRVEMRVGETFAPNMQSGDMQAGHTGEIVSITALRGTPLKKAGDTVCKGDSLVGGWFVNGEERVSVAPIARVSIACLHEAEYEVESEEEAFAKAYLALGLEKNCTVEEKSVEARENGFFVRIAYTAVESINL